MITHHPDPDLLLDYASGSLVEPLALLVACHVALCASCRDQSVLLDDLGGALLGEVPPAQMGSDALARAIERLDVPEEAPREATPALDAETRKVIPSPLWRYIDQPNLSRCRWRRLTPSMREMRIATAAPSFRTSLYRVRPGGAIPPHRHRGHEYTVVFAGGLLDADGEHLVRGDLALADSARHHVQVADPDEPCVCLTVLEAPVRLTGPLGFIVNPFLRC